MAAREACRMQLDIEIPLTGEAPPALRHCADCRHALALAGEPGTLICCIHLDYRPVARQAACPYAQAREGEAAWECPPGV